MVPGKNIIKYVTSVQFLCNIFCLKKKAFRPSWKGIIYYFSPFSSPSPVECWTRPGAKRKRVQTVQMTFWVGGGVHKRNSNLSLDAECVCVCVADGQFHVGGRFEWWGIVCAIVCRPPPNTNKFARYAIFTAHLTVSQKKKNLIFFIGRWRPGIACFLLYFCPSLFCCCERWWWSSGGKFKVGTNK